MVFPNKIIYGKTITRTYVRENHTISKLRRRKVSAFGLLWPLAFRGLFPHASFRLLSVLAGENILYTSLGKSQTLFATASKKCKALSLVRLDKQTTWFGRGAARPTCRTRLVCPPSKAIGRYTTFFNGIYTVEINFQSF